MATKKTQKTHQRERRKHEIEFSPDSVLQKKKTFSFQWFDLLKTCCDLFSIDRLNLKISVFYYFSFQTFVMLFSDGNIFQLVLTRTFFVLMQITKRI
jgi:hypothetical protein